jgi:hypothetical protein
MRSGKSGNVLGRKVKFANETVRFDGSLGGVERIAWRVPTKCRAKW